MTDADTIHRLIAALKNYKTRPAAHRELLKLGTAATGALTELLGDKDAPENVRWVAITILGELKAVAATAVLLTTARDCMHLRTAACQALQSITGKELGEDMAAWERALAADSAATGERVENPDFALVRNAMGNSVGDISWEDSGYVYMRVSLQAGKSQQVVATFENDPRTGARQLSIYTECGLADAIPTSIIDRRNVTLRYGKFHAEKDDTSGKYRITLRHALPLDKLNPAELHDIVMSLAFEADSMEYELTGVDRI